MSAGILHLHNDSNWDGNLEHVRLVLSGLLSESAFRLYLAAPPEQEYLARFRELGVSLLPFRARSRSDLRAALSLARLCRRRAIQIVHSHRRQGHQGRCVLSRSTPFAAI